MGRMTPACGALERLSLGAYVLGALEPVERAQLEAHLGDCTACREELAELAALPGLLARVSVEDVLDSLPAAPPGMAERLVERMRAARRARRRRLVALAGAVAAVAVAALVVATVDLGPGTSGTEPASVSATSATTGVTARIGLRPASWGTAVRVRLQGVRPGTRCRLVVHSRSGRREIAGTWRAAYDGRADVVAATAIPRTELASFEVVTASGRRLLRAPLD
jgi:hypothetical protein